MPQFDFSRGKFDPAALIHAFTFRYPHTPAYHQGDAGIYSDANPDHPEGYDNFSLLYPEKCAPGAKAALRCSFEGLGCPEIILVEEAETCPDGAVRYGKCIEVVLYEKGINVWRHFMEEDHHCFWHKRLGLEYAVAENTPHLLEVETAEKALIITLDGQKTYFRTEDLPESFYFGVTLCEGRGMLYSLDVQP